VWCQISATCGLLCSDIDCITFYMPSQNFTFLVGTAALQTACWWHVSHSMDWSIDLYVSLEFWMFLQPQSNGLNLYADCLINQSIYTEFVGCRCTTRPGAPTIVSGKHDQKVHSWVVFWMYTGITNVIKVGRKSVPGGRTTEKKQCSPNLVLVLGRT